MSVRHAGTALLCSAALLASACAHRGGQGEPVALCSTPEALERPLTRVEPEYPRAAVIGVLEGWVELAGQVDSRGDLRQIVVLESMPRGLFDESALEAVSQWTYCPATEEEGWSRPVRVRLEFSLRQRRR